MNGTGQRRRERPSDAGAGALSDYGVITCMVPAGSPGGDYAVITKTSPAVSSPCGSGPAAESTHRRSSAYTDQRSHAIGWLTRLTSSWRERTIHCSPRATQDFVRELASAVLCKTRPGTQISFTGAGHADDERALSKMTITERPGWPKMECGADRSTASWFENEFRSLGRPEASQGSRHGLRAHAPRVGPPP